jgi:ADP-ribose pyrophosphatase YjhB (NUDIX family)
VDDNGKYGEWFGDPSSFLPGISIDCVIIGFDLNELNILLLKWKEGGHWMLPGGFVHKDEDMDHAASRILEERTGIRLPYLKQFHTFGDLDRRANVPLFNSVMPPGAQFKEMVNWLEQRFISLGYLSLVDMRSSVPAPDFMSETCVWKPLKSIPDLIYDHNLIANKALEQIRNQINYLPIGISLLPEKFTMKELQILYEEILQKKVDRANFQKKILKLGFLNRHEKQLTGGAHKAPFLYAFNREKYNLLLEKGIGYMS